MVFQIQNKSGWERIKFTLTPSNISQYLQNARGTLICAPMSGDRWSSVFLNVGYQAFIAPKEPDIACNSYTLFLTGFFYYLTAHGFDYSDRQFSPQEATAKASAMDRDYQFGTQLFRYYGRSN